MTFPHLLRMLAAIGCSAVGAACAQAAATPGAKNAPPPPPAAQAAAADSAADRLILAMSPISPQRQELLRREGWRVVFVGMNLQDPRLQQARNVYLNERDRDLLATDERFLKLLETSRFNVLHERP